MLKKLFGKPEMIYGDIYINVDKEEALKDYTAKATIIGWKCNSRNVRYCINYKTASTRWLNDEHTKAVIGFEGDRKAWNVIEKFDFVYGTSKSM